MSRPTNTPEDYIGPCGCDEARDPWTRCDVCEANGWTPPTDDPATLRARLQERYGRPERPCTYDPADEEPEAEPVSRVDIEHRWTDPEAPPLTLRMEYEQADWTPPRPAAVEYSGIPVVVDPEQEEGTVRLVSFDPMVTRYPSDIFAPVAPPMTPMTPESTARRDAERAHFAKRYPEIMAEVLGTGPDRVAYGTTHLAPTVTPPRDRTAREVNVIAESNGWPKMDTTGDTLRRAPTTCPTCHASIEMPAMAGWYDGVVAWDPDGAPHTCPTVEPKAATKGGAFPCPECDCYLQWTEDDPTPRESDGQEHWCPMLDQSAAHLRSYLRTLTNPDAPAEDVAAALDLLTDEDFALVDPRNVEGFKLLNALPLMKRVRVAPTKRNP